jgi:hypothetical protein
MHTRYPGNKYFPYIESDASQESRCVRTARRTMRAMPAEATAWLGDATEPAAPPPPPALGRMPAGAVAADSAPLPRRPLRLHSWSTSCGQHTAR